LPPFFRRAVILLAILGLTPLSAARAGAGNPQVPWRQPATSPASSTSVPSSAAVVDGPPSPVAPAVITRDDKGGATMRGRANRQAVEDRWAAGRRVYRDRAWRRRFHHAGAARRRAGHGATDTWVLFDSENLYIAARCWDDHPERWVVTELRHDNGNIIENENLSVSLDTFHDRRNGFMFQTNPLGALREQAFTDEVNINSNWNTVWQVKSGRFEEAGRSKWSSPSSRFAIGDPVLRCGGSTFDEWSSGRMRTSFLTRVPRAYGRNGIFRVSSAGTLGWPGNACAIDEPGAETVRWHPP
jgi:hypothetical protein